MKLFFGFFIGIALLFLNSCSNKQSEEKVVSQKFVHKYGFDVSEQEWAEREKDGQIITTLHNGVTIVNTYKNGELHGDTTFSFPSSDIVRELHVYDEGVLLKKVVYEENSMPLREDVYEFDDRKIITLWNSKGLPLSIEVYERNALMSGKYFNERNEVEAAVSDGKGVRVKKDRSNILVCKDRIENGQVIERTKYYPNGKVQSVSNFLDYKLHGEQKTFTPSGKPALKMQWNHGVLDGIKVVYRNNVIHKEIPYIKGEKHGVERHFHSESGALAAEIHWVNDRKHGSARFFDEDHAKVAWYYHGKAVSLKQFEILEFREEMLAELQDQNPSRVQKAIE